MTTRSKRTRSNSNLSDVSISDVAEGAKEPSVASISEDGQEGTGRRSRRTPAKAAATPKSAAKTPAAVLSTAKKAASKAAATPTPAKKAAAATPRRRGAQTKAEEDEEDNVEEDGADDKAAAEDKAPAAASRGSKRGKAAAPVQSGMKAKKTALAATSGESEEVSLALKEGDSASTEEAATAEAAAKEEAEKVATAGAVRVGAGAVEVPAVAVTLGLPNGPVREHLAKGRNVSKRPWKRSQVWWPLENTLLDALSHWFMWAFCALFSLFLLVFFMSVLDRPLSSRLHFIIWCNSLPLKIKHSVVAIQPGCSPHSSPVCLNSWYCCRCAHR